MERIIYDVGYGVEVNSMHCEKCGFNVTDPGEMKKKMFQLRKNMEKAVKVIRVGTGLGIRFPNHIVQCFKLKKGAEIKLMPDKEGVRIIV